MKTSVIFLPECEHSNPEVESNPIHAVAVTIDSERNYALIKAKSREALYEFGRSLMEEALYGHGEAEFYPLVVDGTALVVNGVRLPEGSARLFVHYPREGGIGG
ncbi:hypothetical protein [Undibacterium rugosum]|uniref:hypothetical protein n=1 Tax=Undibacterium rugosum TaxID=2762291 RepID=UPI001B84064C|nr:hypothetical protein [Undibacterium rugosum]MBR7780424.1 hypothetical protein [Undibacterium rugosum]